MHHGQIIAINLKLHEAPHGTNFDVLYLHLEVY